MQLYLMQHGTCYSKDVNPKQPLSPMGTEQIEQSAMAVRAMGLRFDAIATSPKVRAHDSAKIMARVLGYPKQDILITDDLKAMTPPAQSWEFLKQLSGEERVFVAGHLPNLVELAGLLIAHGEHLALNMENGGLLRLDVLDPERPAATLMWYLPQAMLGLVAGVKRGIKP